MSRDYNYIRDLNKDSDIWKIGFRLLESWTVVGSNGNQHVKLIIGDAKVRRIWSQLLRNLLWFIYVV